MYNEEKKNKKNLRTNIGDYSKFAWIISAENSRKIKETIRKIQ